MPPSPNSQNANPFNPSSSSSPDPTASPNPNDYTDWTEGANATEIAEALDIRGRNSGRRDSMSGWGGEDEGHQTSIFDGPGSYSIPSSVTSMHHHQGSYGGRRSMSIDQRRPSSRAGSRVGSRRPSMESRRTVQSTAVRSEGSDGGGPVEAEGEGLLFQSRHRKGEDSDDDEDEEGRRKGGVFGGIAAALGFGSSRVADEEDDPSGQYGRSFSSQRSRPSLRHRSSSRSHRSARSEALSDGDLSDDNWGYSSNEDDSDSARSVTSSQGSIRSENNDLIPLHRSNRHPESPSEPTIPLLPQDPVFSSSSAHHHEVDSARNASQTGETFAFPEIASAHVGSRQIISLPDEDLSILFTGYETVRWKEFVWWIGVVLSAGILGLVGRWVPGLWVRWVGKETNFAEETKGQRWLLVEVRRIFESVCAGSFADQTFHSQTPFKDLNIIPLQSVSYPYPLSTVFPPKSSSSSQTHLPNGDHASFSSMPVDAKDMVPLDVERGSVTWEDTMGFLKVVDYRYTRFALDERQTGKEQWRMIRFVLALSSAVL